MSRFIPDRFTLALLATVLLASILPAEGKWEVVAGWAGNAALVLLFFLQGARLPLETVVAGLKRPGLHLLIVCSTFVLFPVLGLGLHALLPGLLPTEMWLGLLFVCMLSSTVQSSIAFTSIAKGNVPVALCAATFSNLAGVALTPMLVALLLHRQGNTGGLEEMAKVMAQLVLPFAVGSISRRWIADWAMRNKLLLSLADRGSILIAVYGAFSAAVVGGVWSLYAPTQLLTLLLVEMVLLGTVMLAMLGASRLLRLSKEDEVAVLFCGSKKSLASGVPMAAILFGAQAGMVVVPIMLFHQMQLMLCAYLARRYAEGFARREKEALVEA